MATQVRRRRGTEEQYISSGFIGAEGEFTYDESAKTIRVHDGVTPGGFKLIRQGPDLEPASKCKITYNKQGIITGGSDLEMSDLPLEMPATYVLKNANITPVPAGSWKCKVRYDAKGLVVEGGDLTASDMPSGISQSKIQNLQTDLAGKMPQIKVDDSLATSGSIQLIDNTVNRVILTGSATLLSPIINPNDHILHQCLVQLYKPDIAYNVAFAAVKYFGSSSAPDISSVGYYNIYYEYDAIQNAWVIGAIRKIDAA